MEQFDLRKISKILEIVSIVVLVCGVIASLVVGIHKRSEYSSSYVFEWSIILGGFVATFVQAVFILFFSRIGFAVADLRDKFCEDNDEEEVPFFPEEDELR